MVRFQIMWTRHLGEQHVLESLDGHGVLNAIVLLKRLRKSFQNEGQSVMKCQIEYQRCSPQRSRRMPSWNLSPLKHAGYQTEDQAGPRKIILSYVDLHKELINLNLNTGRDIDWVCCCSGAGERGARAWQVGQCVVGLALQELHLGVKSLY